MVAKDENGLNTKVPGLLLSNHEELRRFYTCVKQIATKKDLAFHEEIFDYKSEKAILELDNYNVKLKLN